jgi:hypothetical protein
MPWQRPAGANCARNLEAKRLQDMVLDFLAFPATWKCEEFGIGITSFS